MQPFVSVVTPTYNRRKFIPSLIRMYESQTYSKTRMEWIIFDDGTDKVRDLFEDIIKRLPNIRYIENDDKLLIGQKRNKMNKEARGDIIVSMDDDDFYPPCRVAHVVMKFAQNPSVELAGSSEMYIYYDDTKKIYKLGPYGPTHATNGTMAWRKSYSNKHIYDETVTHAEEKSYLDNYINPMIQLDPMKVILVVSHTDNTFDKKKIRDNPAYKHIKVTAYKLKQFIADKRLRDFFLNI